MEAVEERSAPPRANSLRARQEIVESGAVLDGAGIPGWLGLPYVAVMIDHNPIRERFAALSQHLDERSRRVFAAAEAKAAGYGGIAAVWRATGIAPSTINPGTEASSPPWGWTQVAGGV
jgi:hypothetical protein